ncbi:MAG: hypothetical protein EBR86_09580 [Planctomycetia bacterium]|nr:hypothetical protein [Planctomycetia bacterium]
MRCLNIPLVAEILCAGLLGMGWTVPGSGATADGLAVGDRAPPLDVERWIVGAGLERCGPGAIHAVTFLDLHSRPCREALPHLGRIATRHAGRGVVMVGIDGAGPDSDGEWPSLLADLGPQRAWRIGVDRQPARRRRSHEDDQPGMTWQAWMSAADEDGIPTTFVVDATGHVAWIGHPLDGLDEVIDGLLAGTFAPLAEADAGRRAALLEEDARTAVERQEWDRAVRLAEELATVQPRLAGRAAALVVDILLFQKNDRAAGCAAALALLDGPAAHDAELLNDIAHTILDRHPADPHAVSVAVRLASRADALVDHANPWVLDTLARGQFLSGEEAAAVALQKEAVDLITGLGEPREQRTMRRQLRRYRAALEEAPAP